MSDPRYGYVKQLEGTNFSKAVTAVTDALKQQGFGVLTEIDVKATLKKKIDVDFRNYVILGACNPPLAHRALSAEAQLGLLLPCNVVVQESQEGKILVSVINAIEMFKLVDRDDILGVAHEVDAKLKAVLAAL